MLLLKAAKPSFSLLRAFFVLFVVASLLLGTASQAVKASPLLDPTADVGVDLPAEGMIGEEVTITVTFDNDGAEPNGPGYGPFLDVIIPKTGMDGDDGLIFREGTDTVTYLGIPVNYVLFEVDSTGCIPHPYAVDNTGTALEVCGLTEGDQFMSIELPFGSFVPDQPPAPVEITTLMSSLADVANDASANLTVQARGGYRFGLDELDNPGTDPSVVGAFFSSEIKPTLVSLSKTYQGPEDETATGPNFPRRYVITVDIANGQTLDDFNLTDYLDNNLEFLSVVTGAANTTPGYTAAATPATPGAQNAPNNELTLTWSSVTGTTGTADVLMTFEFFVPQYDANSAYVLPPLNGDDRLSVDDALAGGDWLPLDIRDRNPEPDPQIAVSTNITSEDHTLTDKSIAIQKSVGIAVDQYATGLTSGDILAYTIQFQISDYFAFQNLVITDVISDGQHFYTDATHLPRLVIDTPESALDVNMDPANYTVAPNYTPDSPTPNDGTTTITFRVSDEMIAASIPGRMVGGCVPTTDTSLTWGTGSGDPDCANGNYGATTGTLIFYTEVLENYTDVYPSGDPSVDQGDVVDNRITIVGDLLSVVDLSPILDGGNPVIEADDSGASMTLEKGNVEKEIYAINGVIGADPIVAAGDSVTYRVTYHLPTGDVEELRFVDYLPLPVFRVGDPDADGAAGPAWTFDNIISADVPPAGVVKFGPDDDFQTITGTIIEPATIIPVVPENSLEIAFGEHDDAKNTKQTIDLLFTVNIQSAPFADGLYLTNQVQSHEENSQSQPHNTTSIVQIQITEPKLAFSKGIVAADQGTFSPTITGPAGFTAGSCPAFSGTIHSNGLDSNPVNSNLTGADAGDTVTYAVVVENTGSGVNGVFDIQLSDSLAAGTSYVPDSLCVTDGTGAAIGVTDLSGNPLADGSELFGSGIELVDPGPTETPAGALDPFNETSGRNIAVITYAVTLDGNVTPRDVLTNTAVLSRYAGREGGVDFLDSGDELTDDAQLTVVDPAAAKVLTGTEFTETNNSATQAVVGETLDYKVTITVPEGETPGLLLVDTLDTGLAFVDCLSVVTSDPLNVTTNLGDFSNACAPVPPPGDPSTGNPAITNSARTITFNLGDVTNTDLDNTTDETITLAYRAVVLNNTSTNQGNIKRNSAVVRWDGGTLTSVRAAASIVEPLLNVNKSVTVDGVADGGGDAGDPVEYTIRLTQTNGRPAAYDVTFSDDLPVSEISGRSLIIGDLMDTSVAPSFSVSDTGTTPLTAANFEMVGSYAAGWTLRTVPGFTFDFEAGSRVITLTVSGYISNNAEDVRVGDTITNTAAIDWTSLDGEPGLKSAYHPQAVERTGAGSYNDYLDSDNADIQIDAPEVGKSITATNQSFTLPNADPFTAPVNVAVGETVSYQVVYTMPEGIAYDVALTDILDPGLAFVSCDDITADPAIQPQSVFTCNNAVISAFPDESDPQNFGRQMNFSLGNITNSASDGDLETIVVNYTVVVLNSQDANNGATLKNTAAGSWAFYPGGPRQVQQLVGPVVTVVEPALNVQKDASITGGAATDAGETVEYTITIQHDGASVTDAFDVQFSDPLPVVGGNPLIVSPVSLVVDDSADILDAPASPGYPFFELVGDDTAGWTAQTTGTGFDFPLDSARTITLTVTGTLSGAVNPDQIITNNADIFWSSLPGDETAAQTTNNDLSCERTGDDTAGVCGADFNDHSDTDPADVTIDSPAISKSLHGTSADHTLNSDVTIGEVVSYDLLVTLPEGTSNNVQVLDAIPAGMAYVGGSAAVVTTAADSPLSEDFNGSFIGFSASLIVDGADGEDVTFSFTTVTVNGDSSADNNAFVIRFQARLLDVSGNVGVGTQTTLNNTAELQINGGTTYNTAPVTVTVVEPQMGIVKEFDTEEPPAALPPAVDDDQAADHDTVVITFSVTNSGTSDAFEVVVEDPLPTARFGSIVELTTPAGFTFTDPVPVVGGDAVVTYSGGTIPAGDTVYFSYQATVLDLSAGETYTNTAKVTQATTLEGTDPGERDEPEVEGSDDLEGIAPDLVLTKDDGHETVQAGWNLTYTIRVENVGGRDATGVTITDQIPPNTIFGGTAGWSCVPDGNPGAVCTYVVGALASGASVNVPFDLVVNNPLAASVETITNLASVTDDGTHGEDPTPEDNEDDDIDTVDAYPDLVIEKDDGGIAVTPEGVVVYTIRYTNQGSQNATGVEITEIVPANTTFDAGSSTAGWSCADGDPAGTVCTYAVGALAGRTPPNDPVYQSVSFAVKVDGPTLAAGIDEVSNVVSIADDGANGPEPTENNSAGDDTPVDAAPDINILKSDGEVTTIPGGTVVYTLTYANVGNQDATGVQITETVPPNTTFDADLSDGAWDCVEGDPAGTVCTLTVGDLAAGAGSTVDFAVTVNNPLPASVTQINNTAVIADDGDNGPDPTDDNEDSDDTPLQDVDTVPDLTLTKDDGGVTADPGGTVVYTLTYANVGTQEATNVVISETVPENTTFDADLSDAGWSCAEGDPAGTVCSLTILSLAGGGAGGSVDFAVTVDNPVPAGVEQIENAALITDDGTNGEDPTDEDDPVNNNEDEEDTPLNAVPDLSIIKDDGLDQVSGGETLTYTLTITNTGTQHATGVQVVDTIPENTTYVSSQRVDNSEPGSYDDVEKEVSWTVGDLEVGESISFVVVVVVDDPLDESVTSIDNVAAVTDDESNGVDPTPEDNEVTDSDAVRGANKRLEESENHPYNVLPEVSIGEILTYEVDLTVAAGATIENVVLIDTLDRGLAIVDVVSITSPGNAITAAPNDFAAIQAGAIVGAVGSEPVDQGRMLTMNFGALTNTDTENDVVLTVRYRAVVLDYPLQGSGDRLNNQAVWTWTGGILQGAASEVEIVEPELSLCKEADTRVAEQGDLITFTLTLSPMPEMETAAFDVLLQDTVPSRMRYVEDSLISISGQAPDLLDDSAAPLLQMGWEEFLPTDEPAVLQFQARIRSFGPGESITNTALIKWSSLPGDFSTPQSAYNTLSTEREYDPLEPVCISERKLTNSFTINHPGLDELPATGFAPGRVTVVGRQPDRLQYQDLGRLWLDIPKLGVKTSIVGVPQSENGWNLDWLGSQVGYLAGTAFPGWAGNTGLTAHVYDATGKAGPFVHLDQLVWGDHIVVHYQGQRYTYEVREVERVAPTDLSPLRHEEYPWVTLVTCQGYNETHDRYNWRLVVRAVQISVELE